jgi:hypothetical protein
VVALNGGGTTRGDDLSFVTSAAVPSVITGVPGAVTTSSATLRGTVNAENSDTVVTFEYGLDAGYGTTVQADQSPVAGIADTAVSRAISGLTANTTYHYRVVGINTGGTTYGDDRTFFTALVTMSASVSGAQDGWVLESSETSGLGGSLNSTATTFKLGDDSSRRQYRAVLSFNTGARLPDNAVITAVTLKLKGQGSPGGGNLLTAFKGLMVDVKNGFFGSSVGLQNGDFQAAASHAAFGPFRAGAVNSWYTLNLSGAKAYINRLAAKGGLTQIRLRFALDDNNDAVANVLSLYSGNAGPANRPQLIITYYVP